MAISHYWSIYTVHGVLWRHKMDRRSRIDMRWNIFFIADDMDDIDIVTMTTFTAYGVHLQRMLGNLAQHCKSRSAVSQSDWRKVGSVDGWSANRWSRSWRSKIHGKTKHSKSTINSEVNRRSVNWRSNLIWLAMEKPDLSLLFYCLSISCDIVITSVRCLYFPFLLFSLMYAVRILANKCSCI